MGRSSRYVLMAAFAALVLSASPSGAFSLRRKSAPSPAAEKKAAAPSAYDKVLRKKGLKSAGETLKVHVAGTDVWLEVPDSLMGRKLLMSSILKGTDDPRLPVGQKASTGRVFLLDRTDSLLIFRTPSRLPVSSDTSLSSGLSKGRGNAVSWAFPIVGRSKDSTSLLVKATKLFDPSDKNVINPFGIRFGAENFSGEGNLLSELSFDPQPVAVGSGAGVSRYLTYDVEVGYISADQGSISPYRTNLSGTFLTLLSLVPERELPVRVADPRVGVRTQEFLTYSPDTGVRTEKDAVRWNLRDNKEITVYVDTLFSPSWQAAVRKGVEAWNVAFREIGLGRVVYALPFPDDGIFSADDPLTCKILSSSCESEYPQLSIFGSGLTGGVLGATITVPLGFRNRVRKTSLLKIADVDSRYDGYEQPDDAVCEVLTAEIMNLFGQILGLLPNSAGSAAWSPSQLRDPAFTLTHGITASVMDDVMFNYLARPGDKERGVVTVVDRIGPYDRFAIEWLYREFPEGTDEKAELRALAGSHEGDPEYLYLPFVVGNPDYRALRGDLGNDIVAAYEAGISHLKHAVKSAKNWIYDPVVPYGSEGFRDLYPEWIWLAFNDYSVMLSSRIGGLRSEDLSSGRKVSAVPREEQKRCLETMYEGYDDVSWLDDEDIKATGGLYRTLGDINRTNIVPQSRVRNRLPYVVRAWKEGESGYSPEEYLSDVSSLILARAAKGKLNELEDNEIDYYIRGFLMQQSPSMKANYALRARTASLAAPVEIAVPVTGVPLDCLDEVDLLCARRLRADLDILRSGVRRATDPHAKGRLEYLVKVAEMALGIE